MLHFQAAYVSGTAAGCAKVFKEQASGAKSDRAELAKVLRRLDHGDVLVVTRLDRLARSTRDLLNVIEELTKRAGLASARLGIIGAIRQARIVG